MKSNLRHRVDIQTQIPTLHACTFSLCYDWNEHDFIFYSRTFTSTSVLASSILIITQNLNFKNRSLNQNARDGGWRWYWILGESDFISMKSKRILAFLPFRERPLSFRRARILSTVKLCRSLSGKRDFDPSASSQKIRFIKCLTWTT